MLYVDTLPMNAQQTRAVLQDWTDSNGVFFDLDRILDYRGHFIQKMIPLYNKAKKLAKYEGYKVTKADDTIYILKHLYGVPEELMQVPDFKTGGTKLSVKSDIREKLLKSERVSEGAKEFIRIVNELVDLSHAISYLSQYMELPVSLSPAYNGNRMVVGRPKWSVLSTSRVSAREPSIQNIDRRFGDIRTWPKGYSFVRVDSGQIEPRTMYSWKIKDPLIKQLIIEYNDAYTGIVRYVLLTPDEEMSLRYKYNLFWDGQITNKPMNFIENIELKKDLDMSLRSKIKTCVNAGNYGGNLEDRINLEEVGVELMHLFNDRITRHPLRLKLEEEVKQEVYRGVHIFHGYFGTPVDPLADPDKRKKYPPGSTAERKHLVRCGINNPIQTTASELMCASVHYADKILREKSYGKSSIAYYKHDEGAFYIHDSEKYLIEYLKEATAYQVANWIPIYSDLEEERDKGMAEVETL